MYYAQEMIVRVATGVAEFACEALVFDCCMALDIFMSVRRIGESM